MTRKPIGITVPYREVGYKEKETLLKQLEKQVKSLTERVTQLEKANAQTKQVQTEGRTS
jgi:hypothetical protein